MAVGKINKFIDIGANLTDLMYSGVYNGTNKHQPDLQEVLKRSWDAGLNKIIITGTSLSESKRALDLAKTDDKLYCTVGCHPTNCEQFESETDPKSYLNSLRNLVEAGKQKVVAIGECGLDYDRLNFCPKDKQLKYFEQQLLMGEDLKLPFFFHCRNAASDLIETLKKFTGLRGVVHSFDGNAQEAETLIAMGYYIGINGCSLKTEFNLNVLKTIPSNRILLETDSPWCEVRPSHAGYNHIRQENKYTSVKKEKWTTGMMIKGRNEPANIQQILDIVAVAKNEQYDELVTTIYKNTMDLFF